MPFFRTFWKVNIGGDTDTILTIRKWYLLAYSIDPVSSKNDKDEHKKS